MFDLKKLRNFQSMYSLPCLLFCSIFILSVTSKAWIQENLGIETQILSIIFFITLIIINAKAMAEYIKDLSKLKIPSVDILLYLSISLYFIWNMQISIYALSCLALYIFYSAAFNASTAESKNFRTIIFSIFIVSLIGLLGVFGGLAEYLFANSHLFYKLKEVGYPMRFLSILPFHASGIQYTYNGSAYLIMCSLGLVKVLQISRYSSNIIQLLVFSGLILTQSKIGLLFIALLLALQLTNNQTNLIRILLICLIGSGYLMLAHITFIDQGSVIESEKYFREYLFTVFGLDIYLSLFSWLKIQLFNFYIDPASLQVTIGSFVDYAQLYEPHFMYGSALIFGGTLFALILFAKVVSVIVPLIKIALKKDIYFLVLALTLFIESFVWDAYDSPIFWGIIILAYSYQREISRNHMPKN